MRIYRAAGTGGAPTDAHYVTTQAEAGLSAEVSLGALTTGLLKHAVAAGVSTPATATPWTDYAPGLPTAAAGGTVDVITATYSPAVTLTNGTRIILVAAGANTGAVTFAPNALAAKAIVKYSATALVAGDIPAVGYPCDLEYNGTAWVLLNPSLETRLGGATAPTATELTYLDATSSVQTQLAAKASSTLDATLADGEYTGITRTLVAFNDIDCGELVEYKLDTTLKFQLSDVSTDMAAVGMSVSAGTVTAGNPVTILLAGRFRTTGLPTLTIGAPVYRHISTDGAVQVAAPAATGNKLQMIGFGDVDGDTIYFDPSQNVFTVA